MHVHDVLVSSAVSSDVNVSRLRTFIAYIHVTMLSDLNVEKARSALGPQNFGMRFFPVLEIMQ